MLRRKLPRYCNGGVTKDGTNPVVPAAPATGGTGNFMNNLAGKANAITQASMLGGTLVSAIDGADGQTSYGGAIGSGALTGMGLGLQLGSIVPGIGHLIGGIGGLLGGGIAGYFGHKSSLNKQKQEELSIEQARKNTLLQQHAADSAMIMGSYPGTGLTRMGYYAAGGAVTPTYEAEGGEVIEHPQSPVAVAAGGGLVPITQDMSAIVGRKHEQGGVPMTGGEFIYSDQIFLPDNFDLKI